MATAKKTTKTSPKTDASDAQETTKAAAKVSKKTPEKKPPAAPEAEKKPASKKPPVKKPPVTKPQTTGELSEAQLLAMPEDDYMNEAQMAFFRARLVELKNNILANADETTQNLREDSQILPDPADRATIEEEHALELRTRDRERKLLKKIEQSIARIDSKDYGYCDDTGEAIGLRRLLARPTATLSLEAQARRELRQKQFGD